VNEEYRAEEDIVAQNAMQRNTAASRHPKAASTCESGTIASLQVTIDMLSKDLKNALSEIKRLSAENEQLKKKGNESKKDGWSPESDNKFIPVRHRKQPRSGGTVLPREQMYTKQTQNESHLSANKYSCLSNITSTEIQEAENDSE
jgi:hypothetical protein